MDAPASSGRRVRTGLFEIDFGAVEIHKEGRRIPLQEQPFRVLAVLLEHPGEVITREELHGRLWPTDTFVGFDEGINTAIRKLRVAFGDSADSPRFIETIPRRGYRFIAPVHVAIAEPAPLSEKTSDGSADAKLLDPDTVSAPMTISEKASGGKHWKLAIPAALAVLAFSVGSYSYLHRKPKLAETDTIVLADFSNSTGDAVFDDTLKTALTISLRQSPFLNVLPDSQVAATLQLMTRPADTRLTPDVARELCLRAGSKAYIAGAIGSLGSEYVLGLKAVNCNNGDTLAQEQVTVAFREQVLDTLGKAASKLRTELGESLSTVQTFDVPLAEATTSSLEALKAYSLGAKAFHEKGAAAALPFNQRAIELDPSFAMGYRAVGVEYNALGEVARASEYYTKAFKLREHTSEREKLEIIAGYHATVTGDADKAVQVYEEKIARYPRDALSYLNLGVEYGAQGQYEKAAAVTRQGLRLAPDQSRFYSALSAFALALQRFGDSRQAIRDAPGRKLDDCSLHCDRYAAAFLEVDSATMAEQQQWLARNPEYATFGLALASDTEAYGGHLRNARELTRRAVESARRADDRENGAIWQTNAAVQEAAYGNPREARQTAAEALKLAPASQGAASEAALAFAMAGETARAESLAQDLERRFPLDTQIQSLWLPAIRAQLALNKKNPTSALNALQAASAIELGNIQFVNNTSCLYHVYIRGKAYLAAGQGDSAAVEFQKILDHSGIVWNCWTGALAHLGLARAYALKFRAAKGAEAETFRIPALNAYNDFLTLWKNADPNIPVLQQAKTEYAKLK